MSCIVDKYISKSKEWFILRIGKRIYRDRLKASHLPHTDMDDELIVKDESLADDLASLDAGFINWGVYSNYRDNKGR